MEERTVIIKQVGSFRSFVTGALLGAGLALLFAPQTGRETREIIGTRGEELKDRAVTMAKDTRARAQVTIDNARNKIQETVKGVKERVSEEGEVERLKRELEITEEGNNRAFPL